MTHPITLHKPTATTKQQQRINRSKSLDGKLTVQLTSNNTFGSNAALH